MWVKVKFVQSIIIDCYTWVDALDQVRRSTEKLKEKAIWLVGFVQLEGFRTMDGMVTPVYNMASFCCLEFY